MAIADTNISFSPREVIQFEFASARERATWVYGMLRSILDVPVSRRTEQLARLTETIDAHPHRDEIRAAFRDFWSHHSYVRVISEAGLPDEIFLLPELLGRAAKRLLPEDEVRGDLYVLLDSLELKQRDAMWLASLPDELVRWWSDIFSLSASSMLASCKILALRASNVALSRDLLTHVSDDDITKSSFFHLPSLVESVVLHPEEYPLWIEQRDACVAQLREINERLEKEGTSAGLIFRLRLLRSFLWRIDQVFALRRPGADARKFAVSLVLGFASQRGILKVTGTTFRRLARSIVEKTGRVGSHYIAQNARHWRSLGAGALMAGVITCFTAVVKYGISAKIHPPFLVALGHSLNYAVSFLLMQAGGFLLASKMPAATAATLVDAMEDPAKDHMASLQAISQTQCIVTLGNLLGAIPSSIAVDRLWHAVTGHPFLTAEEATHGVRMLIPHHSGTIAFAIVTGVLLWLSSLATGWTANYIAIHRMGTSITNSLRIRRRTGSGTRRSSRGMGHAQGAGIGRLHRSRFSAGYGADSGFVVWHPAGSSARHAVGRKSRIRPGWRAPLRSLKPHGSSSVPSRLAAGRSAEYLDFVRAQFSAGGSRPGRWGREGSRLSEGSGPRVDGKSAFVLVAVAYGI